jgi:hypothetical protein
MPTGKSLKIRQILAGQVGTTTAKLALEIASAKDKNFLRTALNMTDKYSGPDRQQKIDVLNQTLQNLAR